MDGGHWVFGYGSLMWEPGFPFVERQPARLHGWHRRFSILSTRRWGTPERPGMSAALHPGGACGGIAYRVAAADWPAAERYLDDRERAYVKRRVRLRLPAGLAEGITYVYDPAHASAADHLEEAQRARLIAVAVGPAGASLDYVRRTLACLQDAGMRPEPRLRRLLALVERACAGAL